MPRRRAIFIALFLLALAGLAGWFAWPDPAPVIAHVPDCAPVCSPPPANEPLRLLPTAADRTPVASASPPMAAVAVDHGETSANAVPDTAPESTFTAEREFEIAQGDQAMDVICEGATVDDLGARLPGIAVKFTVYIFPDDQVDADRKWSTGYIVEGVSDGDGKFRLRLRCGLPTAAQAKAVVCTMADEYRKYDFRELGELIGIELVVPRAASIKGRVVDQQGQPLPDATITVHATDHTQIGRGVTDAAGEYSIDWIEPGPVSLYLYSESHHAAAPAAVIELAPADLLEVAPIVARPYTRGRMFIEFESEGPDTSSDFSRAPVMLQFRNAEGEVVYTAYGAGLWDNGRFAASVPLADLPAGSYRVRTTAQPDWLFVPSQELADEQDVTIEESIENDLGSYRLHPAR